MRLPYAPNSPPRGATASVSEIYTRIAARRAPRPLIPLDLTLLHSPPVADGWNTFLGAIRSKTTLDNGLLELAVCRVAVLNGAIYEWNAHAPLALRGGISGNGLRACRTVEEFVEEKKGEGWYTDGLSKAGWAVMAYTDQMTKQIKVSDKVFAGLGEAGLSDQEIVELTAGVGAYNCVSRFLVALDVGENNDKEMKSVEELEKTEEERQKS
ncbi:Carboxymuconolactone decarboxylase [Ascosphaera apis ARSEF 7405]|uniref:Carboxymuconolactone decarboxylase n=1 Tax=Ascosphaera apis ARSEF 7405 TaxID=392613 RepID=A0A167UV37_9EURO|nr:Carboxymuconolactone decarboxylase [Ascosphaera apis ARSEF 7405]